MLPPKIADEDTQQPSFPGTALSFAESDDDGDGSGAGLDDVHGGLDLGHGGTLDVHRPPSVFSSDDEDLPVNNAPAPLLPPLDIDQEEIAQAGLSLPPFKLAKRVKSLALAGNPSSSSLRPEERSRFQGNQAEGVLSADDGLAKQHLFMRDDDHMEDDEPLFKNDTDSMILESNGHIRPGFEESLRPHTPMLQDDLPSLDNSPDLGISGDIRLDDTVAIQSFAERLSRKLNEGKNTGSGDTKIALVEPSYSVPPSSHDISDSHVIASKAVFCNLVF